MELAALCAVQPKAEDKPLTKQGKGEGKDRL